MKLFAFILAFALVVACACAHSDSEIRYYCLRQAHSSVNAPKSELDEYERMVRELYLRCLEAHHTQDGPIDPKVGTSPAP